MNKGMVVPFSKRGVNDSLGIENGVVHSALKTLLSKGYLTKIGNWQHAWYYVTEDGDMILREEVGLPEEQKI
jgi:predicted transcriptional regulator